MFHPPSDVHLQKVARVSVRMDPESPTRKRLAEFAISRTFFDYLNLQIKLYKIQLVQDLKPNDLNLYLYCSV